MGENQNISDDELLAAFKGEQPTVSYPVYSKEEAKGISDEEMLSAFKGTSPGMQTSGGTLSGGGGMFVPEMLGSHAPADESSLVQGGALGSGNFAPYSIKVGKFDPYAGITDPATRKGLVETVFSQITDPQELDELQKKVPWYNMSENPVQTDSLFQYKWEKASSPFEIAHGAAEAGLGMLTSLPPLVLGAGRLAKDALMGAMYAGDPTEFGKGRTLTEEQKKGMSDRQIQDAELSDRDKLIRSSRAFGDAALEAEEQLRKAALEFAENKSMLWDKARVNVLRATANFGDPGFTPAVSIEEENARRDAASAQAMVDARRNFEKRLNAKHVEFLQKERTPAVLAREIESAWKYPAVKSFAIDVIENLMPSAEDIAFDVNSGAPGFGGDFAPVVSTKPAGGIDLQAAKVLRRAQAAEAAEAGVQAAIAEANRLREDPEQVGAIAMTTPLNIVGAGGMVLGGLGRANQALVRGLRAVGKTEQEINAMFSAERAALQAERANAAMALEQPGRLERALGSTADRIDKVKAAIGDIPLPAQYAGMAALGGIGGAVTSEDPLAGFVKGAGAGAAGRLGMKLGGEALLNAPRLGQELLKAGRLSGAEMGRFEALEKLGSASPEVQRFVNWSQKAGGGQALDFIEKNANVFVQHNISMLPMMVAMGVLEDKDAQEFAQMWAEFATYGFIHGQVLGGILGNDPVRARMDRDAQMRQAQRIMLASSPETRSNLTNLNWDRVVEQSQARVDRAFLELNERRQADPNSPETAKANEDYQFALRLHNENLTAPPEARAMFEDGIKLSLAKVSNMINGVLTPNSNMNIELLTREQIIEKMIEANPSYNGPGLPMTEEQALERNPGADGAMISKGKDKNGFSIDPARDTVFINIDNALQKSKLSGESIANTLAHEAVGHGLFSKKEYRESIAPLYNKLFGTEIIDENGNWKQVSPSEPGLSREDLIQKFFTKYLGGKDPQEVASYAKASGVWDQANDTFNTNKIVELMREEVLAEAHAGRFFGDPESPLQRGIGWIASRVSGRNLRAALNHLYSVAGPAVYQQWTSGLTGATYSPEVMRAIRNVESQMKKYDGDFIDAEKGEAVAAPITKKDVMKSKEMLQKYYGDTGKFETKPIAIVTDAQGNVVQSVPLRDNEAFEGSWNFHEDDATGSNLPNRERGFGDIPLELAGVQVPVGGRLQVQRQIAYDEATGKPIERKNKETVEHLKRRVQMLRDAIDNAGDQSQLGRFRAVGGREGDEDLHYTGKLTAEQRAAVAGLPESVVPASIKELLFKYDDLMSRGDGTVLDIDYASRLNDKGNYQAFSPKVRQIVPLQLHLSKAGNFYTTAWDISDLRRKVRLYEKYAKGVFEPWGGDTQKFWNEFRTILLPNLTNADPSVPGWQGLDADPNVAKLKRTIYEKMLGAPNPNVPNVESIPDLPRDKFSRSERKLDKQSSFDQIIKSFRLDSVTAAEENANSAYKYPIPYKARFMPEQEVKPEDQRAELPAVFEPSILKGLRSINAYYMGAGAPAARLPLDTTETFVTRFKPRQNEEDAMVSHGFYSKAGAVLLDKMPNRASAAQLKGILDPQKGSGVKPEELKFSGINQFIDATQAEKGYVTKDDIRKWLKEDYAANFATQTEFGDIGGTQYDKYVLPGGKNYKEVVLKFNPEIDLSNISYYKDPYSGEYQARSQGLTEYGYGKTKEEAFDMLSSRVKSGKYKRPLFTSSHFPDVPDYVAHLRTAEHGTGLLIEEAQSDLHQKAREEGYERFPDTTGWRAEINIRQNDLFPGKNKMHSVYDQQGAFVTSLVASSESQAIQKAAELRREGVPDAPFRKDWPLQLFKYALKDAVESGKEWVGWTGGEAQADRYSLANKIDTLAYDTVNQKLIALRAGNRVFDKSVPTSEVSNYVGKEIAEKLLSSKDRGNGMRMIYPEDMKIGGEGMKGFYDVMLPKEIGKYVKQWGAKVEQGTLEGKKYNFELFNPEGEPEGVFVLRDTLTGKFLADAEKETFASRAEDGELMSKRAAESIAEAFAKTTDAPKIWKIAITPEMRESVAGGQTRFMPSAAELPVSKFEDEYRRVPGQEELDAMKAKLPKYSATVDVSGNRDNLYLIKLFDESDNQIGYAHASRNPKDPTSGLEVESTHIEGDYRGKGYGQALYREIAKLAQGLGLSKLTSSTTSRLAANARSKILETNWRGAGWDAESKVPSNIRFSPAKLDSEYMAAFEVKDEERARELVDQAAKQAGYNYKVYRGVENDYIKGDGYVFGKADQTYFTGNRALAETYANFMGRNPEGVVYDTYLRLENPFIPEDINDAANFEYDAKRLREKGYDGVIGSHGGVEGARNGQVDVAVAFDPSQIKSADPFTYDNEGRLIPLSERFNVGTGDIRFMPAKSEDEYRRVPTQAELDERKARLPKYKIDIKEGDFWGQEGVSEIRIDVYPEGSTKPATFAELLVDPNDPEIVHVKRTGTFNSFEGKGFGDALYREVAKYAQSIGATKLYGEPISRAATLRREKLFNTETGRPDPQGGYAWASSEIPANIRFMPAKKGALEGIQPELKEEERRFFFTTSTERDAAIAELIADGSEKDIEHLNRNSILHAMTGIKDIDISIENTRGVYKGDQEVSAITTVKAKRGADMDAVRSRFMDLAKVFKQMEVLEEKVGAGKEELLGQVDNEGFKHVHSAVVEIGKMKPEMIEEARKKAGIDGMTMADGRVELLNRGDDNEFIKRATAFREAINELGGNVRGFEKGISSIRSFSENPEEYPGTVGYDDPSLHLQTERGAGGAEYGRLNTPLARKLAQLGAFAAPAEGRRNFFEAKDVTKEQAKFQAEVAKVFDSLPENDMQSELTQEAYAALAKEIKEQYVILTSGPDGLKFTSKLYSEGGEPYKNSDAAIRDIRENNRLDFLKTDADAFGPPGSDFSGHPLLKDSGLKDSNGVPLLYNDLFRAVHDTIAHGMFGSSFGPVGEEGAYHVHARTIQNPLARWAMMTETRGQNSWVNYRPEMLKKNGMPLQKGDTGYIPLQDRGFAVQKAALLPLEYALTGDKEVDKPIMDLMKTLGTYARGSRPATKQELAAEARVKKGVIAEQKEASEFVKGAKGIISDSIFVDGNNKVKTSVEDVPPYYLMSLGVRPLPNIEMVKEKGQKGGTPKDLLKLAQNPEKYDAFAKRLIASADTLYADPGRFVSPKGYSEFMRENGITGTVLSPPSMLKMLIETPQQYLDLLTGGFHEEKTVKGGWEAANSGLNGVMEMRALCGPEGPPPMITALHHLWGTLSKQLPPLDQEACWLRLISDKRVLGAIQSSIDGTFDPLTGNWREIVASRLAETNNNSTQKFGNNAKSNANSFLLMLSRHNGRWNEVSDLYKTDDPAVMRTQFWGLNHGPSGIKNKVQGFIGLTFGVKAAVLDRWRWVELHLPMAMKLAGKSRPKDYFEYTGVNKDTPEDPTGIYKNYGTAESSHPAYSTTLYTGLERATNAAINNYAPLRDYLGAHADAGGLHWHVWNAIKNESVGHSSLDLTKSYLQKYGRNMTPDSFHQHLMNSSVYVEGENKGQIVRLIMTNGEFKVERQ